MRLRRARPAIRRRRSRVSNLGAGLIAAVLIGAVCYAVFGGTLPFSGSPFVLKAVFTTETQLAINSPVRIAGVDVGLVTGVRRVSGSSQAAVVSMDINPNGLPIHADATAKIRPRIFLEGNFYVDLQPGTQSAPTLSSAATLPAANTAGPVQLDRILSTLNAAARGNLQTLLVGLGSALSGQPTAAQDASQDPSVRGLTGAQALNLSLKYSADAFKSSAIVNQALLGSSPHDLSGVVVGSEQVFRALGARQDQLASLVSTFDATTSTLASRQQDLSQTIALLPPLLRASNVAFSALDASFGPTQEFARQILPGVRELGPTIDAALPWMAQALALVSPSELGGLVSSLTPAVQDTSSTISSTETLLSGSNMLARCLVHNVIPTGNAIIQDPPDSTGIPVYQELYQSAVGLAGAGQNFDGNGRYLRVGVAGGSVPIATGPLPFQGPLHGNAVLPPLGTRPAWPGQPPPLRSDVPCFKNSPPNLNNVRTGRGS
jgi:phospholipid/cholesterol/gamma-HCH transport system substrate-binding protein